MKKEKKYIIWGSSGHAKVIADIIFQEGSEIDLFVDNDPKAKAAILKTPICFGVAELKIWMDNKSHAEYLGVAAIGGTRGRDRLEIANIFREYGLKLPVIRHKTSVIGLNSTIDEGSHIMANVVISAESKIGKMCIINNSASVDHECLIGDGVHIAPGAVLCGCVKVEDYAMIGAGAIVLPRLKIGHSSIVGAGAIVVNDVPPNTVVFGNPARHIRYNNK